MREKAVELMAKLEGAWRDNECSVEWMEQQYKGKPVYEAAVKIILDAIAHQRRETLEECAKVLCMHCDSELELIERDSLLKHKLTDDHTGEVSYWPCTAFGIRKLASPAPSTDGTGETKGETHG